MMGLGVGGNVDEVEDRDSGTEYCRTRDGVDTGEGGYLLGDVTDSDAMDELAPNGVPFVLAENGRCFCGVDWVANIRR